MSKDQGKFVFSIHDPFKTNEACLKTFRSSASPLNAKPTFQNQQLKHNTKSQPCIFFFFQKPVTFECMSQYGRYFHFIAT